MIIAPAIVVVFILLFGAALAAVGYLVARVQYQPQAEQPRPRPRRSRRRLRRSIRNTGDVFVDELRIAGIGRGQLPYAGQHAHKLLAPAPRVGQYTLYDWLIQQKHGRIWQEVVSTFYDRAGRDIIVGPFFKNTDLPQLQKHFLATLLVVTHTGLTVGTAQAMYSKHLTVVDDQGAPITHGVFDRTVETLGGVLKDVGVADLTIGDVCTTMEVLRPLIVRAEHRLPPAPRLFELEHATAPERGEPATDPHHPDDDQSPN